MDNAEHPKKAAFLRAYALSGNISRAAEVAEVGRTTYYLWTEHDPVFAAAAAQAREDAADRLEEYLYQRAAGAARKVRRVYEVNARGKRVLTEEIEEDGPSDTAAIFLLKGLRPEKYRERSDVTMTTAPTVKAYAGFDPSEV